MKKILLTGFEPFNQKKLNASEVLVRELAQKFNLPFLILPVSYKALSQMLNQNLGKSEYDFILMLGEADRAQICLERVGLNLKDAKIADNDGVLATGEKIDAHGEAAIFSELPLNDWIKNTGMVVSNSAGTYVCNFLYYKILQGSYRRRCLFVHVPSQGSDSAQNISDLEKLIQLI